MPPPQQMLLYAAERQLAICAAWSAARLCEQVRHESRQHVVLEAITKSDHSPVTVADYGAQAIICRQLQSMFPNDPILGEEDARNLRTPAMADQLAEITRHVQSTIDSDDSGMDMDDTQPRITPTQVVDWIDRGTSTQSCDRYWTLDPIDGTKGFLRPDGQYAVALSLIVRGMVQVGVLACPAFAIDDNVGWLFVAVHGQGAFRLSWKECGGNTVEIPLQVCDSTDTTTTNTNNNDSHNLRFVESVESAHGDQERQGRIAKAVGISSSNPDNSLRMDSQAKYAAVAVGSAALYLRLPSPHQPDRRENVWDHAAGVVIVEEAGGKVTDMHGKKLDFTTGTTLKNNQGVVVSNGTLHDKVLSETMR